MKEKLIVFWFKYCLFFVKFWYTLTMLVSRKKNVNIKEYRFANDISEALKGGRLYKKDPINGVLDILVHPTRIQDRLNKNQKIGDCDEHAAYWVSTLLKSKIAIMTWFAFVLYKDKSTGKIEGHALCVYMEHSGFLYWCDYFEPKPILHTYDWVWRVCERQNAEPIAAAMFCVDSLDKNDMPLFGDISKYIHQKTL